MTDKNAAVLILGAGHAGGTVAALLRQYEFAGSITLVGDEPLAPYHRPPLSKSALRDGPTFVPMPLKPAEFYATSMIDLVLGCQVEALDRDAKSVRLSGRDAIRYDHLIIALGSRPIHLSAPGADLAGVVTLRTATDAERLHSLLVPGKHLAIVGGGYVGLEVAASARALGVTVTVIERESRLLARVASPPLSSFFHEHHSAHGVRFELASTVTGFDGQSGHLSGIRLDDGRVIACDIALVGVGAVPNDEIARRSGLDTENGILVDHLSRTSDPAIFAIGDVARRPVPNHAGSVRLESVPNALEQAKQAASVIAGRSPPDLEVPWQWSDQYDVKLQIAGMASGSCRIVLRGSPSSAGFSVLHLNGDRLNCIEAVNSPKDFIAGKQLIADGSRLDGHLLSDPAIALKEAIV